MFLITPGSQPAWEQVRPGEAQGQGQSLDIRTAAQPFSMTPGMSMLLVIRAHCKTLPNLDRKHGRCTR